MKSNTYLYIYTHKQADTYTYTYAHTHTHTYTKLIHGPLTLVPIPVHTRKCIHVFESKFKYNMLVLSRESELINTYI